MDYEKRARNYGVLLLNSHDSIDLFTNSQSNLELISDPKKSNSLSLALHAPVACS